MSKDLYLPVPNKIEEFEKRKNMPTTQKRILTKEGNTITFSHQYVQRVFKYLVHDTFISHSSLNKESKFAVWHKWNESKYEITFVNEKDAKGFFAYMEDRK